jgi:membrane associated rhomboid family serine protease
MFLPIGDEPNPPGRAWVNTLLIAANVAIWLFLTFPLSHQRIEAGDAGAAEYVRFLADGASSDGEFRLAIATANRWDLFVFRHGYRPSEPSAVDLLFAMFLHAGFLHLAGNMLFLWIFGDNVENRLGKVGYLAAWLGTGAAATLTHALFARGSPVPMVGASGAISGVLGAYFLWFPRNRVKVFLAFFPFFMDVVRIPARIVLGIFVVVDNLIPFVFQRTAGGVAYGAHLGGFFAGLALAALLGRTKEGGDGVIEAEASVDDPDALPPSEEPPLLASRRVESLVHRGEIEEAAQAFLDLLPTGVTREVAPGTVLAIARWLEKVDPPEAALAVYQRYIVDHPAGPWSDRANLGAGLILLGRLGRPSAARQHLFEALESTTDPQIAAAAREAIRVAERMGG